MPSSPSPRSRTVRTPYVLVAGVLVLVALAAIGATQGRAEPTGNYRPQLAADPIALGCYPLPEGVVLDLPYVVRTDGEVTGEAGPRRRLVLHWSLLDRDEARARLESALTDAGFATRDLAATADLDDDTSGLVARRAVAGGAGEVVEVRLTDLPNPAPDPIVRGVLELDLPVAERASSDPACDNPFVTKRFEDAA